MREKLSDINHYFDIWHLKKSMILKFLPCVINCIWYLLYACHYTSCQKGGQNRIQSHDHCLFLEVTKVLTKIAKVSGCEAVAEWIKPCTSHLFWSARTTHDGNGEVIWAKFSSFLSHVVNEHEKLENPLFNKCAHKDIIQPRKWLDKGIISMKHAINTM